MNRMVFSLGQEQEKPRSQLYDERRPPKSTRAPILSENSS